MPIRSDAGGGSNVITAYQYIDNAAGNHVQTQAVTRTTDLNPWMFTGYDIENYHKRMKAGDLLPHTSFEASSIEGQASGMWDVTRSTDNYHYYMVPYGLSTDSYWILGTPEITDYVTDTDWDYLVQQAAAGIYSSGHDTLTFLAELHKVRRMFKQFLPKLYNFIKGKNWNQLHRLWLEGRYGWRVLIYDLQNINDALQNFDSERLRYSERRGETVSDATETSSNKSASFCYYTETVSTSWEVSMRGAVTADIKPAQWQHNLAVTGWELVPFSFVIDWVVNVGQFLSSMSFLYVSRAHVASTGYKLTVVKQFKRDYTSGRSNWSGEYWINNLCTAVVRERTPTSVSINPQNKLRLNEFKILDILALILVAYQRR